MPMAPDQKEARGKPAVSSPKMWEQGDPVRVKRFDHTWPYSRSRWARKSHPLCPPAGRHILEMVEPCLPILLIRYMATSLPWNRDCGRNFSVDVSWPQRPEGGGTAFFNCGENSQPRILYPVKISFRIKGEMDIGWMKSRRTCRQQTCFNRIAKEKFFRQRGNDSRKKLRISGMKEEEKGWIYK